MIFSNLYFSVKIVTGRKAPLIFTFAPIRESGKNLSVSS